MSEYDGMPDSALVMTAAFERIERIERELGLVDMVPAEAELQRRLEAQK